MENGKWENILTLFFVPFYFALINPAYKMALLRRKTISYAG
jgi:hypothetical protein